MYQNNIWELLKLFETALIIATQMGNTKIVKILLEQEGININANDIDLFHSILFLLD